MISDSSCTAVIIARKTMFHTTKQHLYLNFHAQNTSTLLFFIYIFLLESFAKSDPIE